MLRRSDSSACRRASISRRVNSRLRVVHTLCRIRGPTSVCTLEELMCIHYKIYLYCVRPPSDLASPCPPGLLPTQRRPALPHPPHTRADLYVRDRTLYSLQRISMLCTCTVHGALPAPRCPTTPLLPNPCPPPSHTYELFLQPLAPAHRAAVCHRAVTRQLPEPSNTILVTSCSIAHHHRDPTQYGPARPADPRQFPRATPRPRAGCSRGALYSWKAVFRAVVHPF